MTRRRLYYLLAMSFFLIGGNACRDADPVETVAEQPQIAESLHENRLAGLPGAVYRSQTDSAIHWQAWTRETFQHAQEAKRLVFAVIVLPQHPGYQEILQQIEASPELVEMINAHYVPVLVDGDASREMSILAADLCMEIEVGLNLPLLLWLTPAADPVAWVPVASGDAQAVRELVAHSHSKISSIWQDDLRYVLNNSARDNEARRARIFARARSRAVSAEPAKDALRAVRNMADLYDATTRNLAEAGGLFPAGTLDVLSSAAIHQALPAELRERSRETVANLLDDLLPSAMFDPLDGGLFSSRRSVWKFPSFHRDCVSQARAVPALLQAYRATGNELALRRALTVIEFIEKTYRTREGLFALGTPPQVDPNEWLWKVEDIERVLPEADRAWWIEATGMEGLGNLPSEVDPLREFFRGNSIALADSPEALAERFGQDPHEFTKRVEAVKKALLRDRQERMGPMTKDVSAHSGASLRMVSAYATAFAVTGNETFREKAVSLLQRCREAFQDGAKLRTFDETVAPSVGEARAFIYALAVQATLDVADITLDQTVLSWSDDVATTLTELFVRDQFLYECSESAQLVDLPINDLVMIFDESTAGLVSFAEGRLASLGRPLVRDLTDLVTPFPTDAVRRPILHTDLIKATLSRHSSVRVAVGQSVDPALAQAVMRLPLQMVHRWSAKPEDQVPAGFVRVFLGGDETRDVNSAAALLDVVLP